MIWDPRGQIALQNLPEQNRFPSDFHCCDSFSFEHLILACLCYFWQHIVTVNGKCVQFVALSHRHNAESYGTVKFDPLPYSNSSWHYNCVHYSNRLDITIKLCMENMIRCISHIPWHIHIVKWRTKRVTLKLCGRNCAIVHIGQPAWVFIWI